MDNTQRANASARKRNVLKHQSAQDRKQGNERVTWEKDRRARQIWASAQSLAVLKDLDRLQRTTGTLSDLRLIPESGNITLYTSGKFIRKIKNPVVHSFTQH